MSRSLSFCLSVCFVAFSVSYAQVPATQDTIVIPGDIPHATLQHAGALESTINGDTTIAGARINPSRVYALQEGHFYFQKSPINVTNPNGTLTIVGIPDPGLPRIAGEKCSTSGWLPDSSSQEHF